LISTAGSPAATRSPRPSRRQRKARGPRTRRKAERTGTSIRSKLCPRRRPRLDSAQPCLYKAALPTGASRPAGAQVAQLVEHVTENHGVGGSIPPLGTTSSSSWAEHKAKVAAPWIQVGRS